MANNEVAAFERLKAEVEELRVKRLAAEREKERLDAEMAEIRQEIAAAYGVGLEDFDKAITDLQAVYERECAELSAEIEAARAKLEEA